MNRELLSLLKQTTPNLKKEEDKVQQTKELLHASNIIQFLKICVETRGGYHLIFAKDKKIDNKLIHNFKITTKFTKQTIDGKDVSDYWFSISSEPNVIVPGTIQGGFKANICNDLFI